MSLFEKALTFGRRAAALRLTSNVTIYTRGETTDLVTLAPVVTVKVLWQGRGEVADAQYVQDTQVSDTVTAMNRAELRLPYGTVIPDAVADRFAAVDGVVYRVIGEQAYDASVWARFPVQIDANQSRFEADLEQIGAARA